MSGPLRFLRLLSLLIGAALLGPAVPGVAQQSQVTPYIEAQQVLLADLNDGDVLTYTAIAAGVEAQARSGSVEAQASYRYERRMDWEDELVDDDVHSGLARARWEAVPDTLSLEAGALAVRARSNGAAPIYGFDSADDESLVQVFSAYAGPSLATRVGDLDVKASYRLGYVKVDDDSIAGLPLVDGADAPDRFDSAVNHSVTASVGMGVGDAPVAWTVGAGYVREDVDRLDQRFEGSFVRGDVVVPISAEWAATGGVGYESMSASLSDFRRGPDGLPIVTPGGSLIEDRDRPRLLAYDQDGLIWDVGVIYRPNRRTEFQARVGGRYGGTTVVGSLRHQLSPRAGLNLVVYDSVDSFGRLVVTDLVDVPTNFALRRGGLDNGLGVGGCVFGEEAGSGVCFDDALRAVTTANFRNRGVSLILSGGRGPWTFSAGAGYSNRKYLVPLGFAYDRVTDETVNLQAGAERQLTRTSGIGFDAYASWYDSGVAGASSVFGAGATASYNRLLFDRLQLEAALGLYTTDSGAFDSTIAQALVGVSYAF